METGRSALDDKAEPAEPQIPHKENFAVFSVFTIQLPDRSIVDSNRQQQPLSKSSSDPLIVANPITKKSDEPLQEHSARSFIDSGNPESQERKQRDIQSNQQALYFPRPNHNIKRNAKPECHWFCRPHPTPPGGSHCGYECTF